MEENIIKIEDLRKKYGDVQALKGISFEVKRGSLFAFLGINGAGKSTTINIICSTVEKDGGKVFVDGFDLDKDRVQIKKRIGIVFQKSVLDATLTVKDNLKSRASLYGIYGSDFKSKLNELSEMFDLGELLPRPYGKLSGGQKRRVDIARGLINSPSLLILDEPTTGLDPQTRQTVWSAIYALREKYDTTVFLTTHYMEEANGADNVVIIDSGSIAAEGTPNELKNEYSGIYLKAYGMAEDTAAKIGEVYGITPSIGAAGAVFKMKDTALASKIVAENAPLFTDFEVLKGDMDDVFLNITGKKLEGGANG